MPVDQNPLNLPIEKRAPTAERVAEDLTTLRRRRSFLVGEGCERQRRGLRADLEFREAEALAWALEIVERLLAAGEGECR